MEYLNINMLLFVVFKMNELTRPAVNTYHAFILGLIYIFSIRTMCQVPLLTSSDNYAHSKTNEPSISVILCSPPPLNTWVIECLHHISMKFLPFLGCLNTIHVFLKPLKWLWHQRILYLTSFQSADSISFFKPWDVSVLDV